MAVLKGAPEIVLKSCSHYYNKGKPGLSSTTPSSTRFNLLFFMFCVFLHPLGQEVPIDASFMKHFEEVYKEIAGQGERVLGFARNMLDTVRTDRRWVGICG